jgi:hypothetical protein
MAKSVQNRIPADCWYGWDWSGGCWRPTPFSAGDADVEAWYRKLGDLSVYTE